MKTLSKTIASLIFCCIALMGFAQPSQDYTILVEDIEFQPGVTIDINVNVFVNENAQSWDNSGKIIAIEGMAHTANCMKPLAETFFEETDPAKEVNEFFAIDSPGKGLSGIPEGNGFMYDQLYFEDYLNIFFAVIDHLNNEMDIYPRTIMGHSLGGLMTLKLQDTLVKQGTNLKEQYGITRTILLAPAIPAPLDWGFIGSPLAQGLLTYAEFFTPEYGSILNLPPQAWVFSLFTNTCCYFPPNTVPGAPTAAEAEALGYVGIEPAPMLLQVSGMPIPPPLPYPYKPRIQANAGIFTAPNGVELFIVSEEFDRMMSPDEESALYAYLTGDASLINYRLILGEETCHDTHIAEPHAVVDILDVTFNESPEEGYQVYNDQFFSDALGHLEMVDIWLPPGYDMNMDQHYPVIYLLHKAFSNENEYEWFLPTLNQMMADGEIDPFIIVKPNGWSPPYLGSCWYNSPLYGNYEDMLLNDLIPYIEGNFRVLPGQEYRFHLGQAMGGHAGWSMSIRNPELFSVVADISGYKNQDLLNQMSVGLVLAESGGAPPYEFSPANGQLSALWFTMLGAYAPNMANPPYFVNVTIDENGNFIPGYVEQYLQDDIASMISEYTQPAETKYWFANGLTDNVAPYAIALAFKDTLDKYGWEYEFYTYDGGYSGIDDPLAEAFRFIDGVWQEKTSVQEIEVQEGWSFISSYLMPANPVIDEIFAEPVAGDDLIFAFNKEGIFWPGQNVNTMDFWWTKQALKVKAANNFTMQIPGVSYEDKTVNLEAGYNYMPVLSEEPVNAADIFNQLGDELHFAFDIGQGLVYWPAGGLFTLNTLEPGAGYFVNTFGDCVADFGNVVKSAVAQNNLQVNTIHNYVPAGNQHVIVIAPEAIRNVTAESVIAVGTPEGQIVATTVIHDATQPAVLVAYGDDPTTQSTEGFVVGDVMELSLVDAETLKIITLIPEFDTEIGLENVYTDWGISKITSFKEGLGFFESALESSFNITPNPVKFEATISWEMPESSVVRVELLDCTGKVVRELANKPYKAGNGTIKLSASGFDPGVYFCKISTPEFSTIHKLIIIR
jgi:enterochelin esterase-like enzyme